MPVWLQILIGGCAVAGFIGAVIANMRLDDIVKHNNLREDSVGGKSL